MRLSLMLATASGLLAGPGLAADVVTAPDWLRRPTPEMLRSAWPTEAWRKGQGGKALITCKISLQGVLFGCRVESEEPAGAGFGAAAIAMTPQFLMKPATRNGQPFVSEVHIPLNFTLPAGSKGGGGDSFGSRRMIFPTSAWIQAPSYADVAAAYPAKARSAGVGGVASLQCGFSEAGVPQGCDVMREEPKGYGFGAAAKALAKQFRAVPETPDGTPIRRAMVQLPVAFSTEMLKDGDPVVGKPNWAQLPSADAVRATFPESLVGATTVRVMLTCRVEQGGAVSGCKVLREDPVGRGFGAAALKLSDQFRLSTWTMEGLPTVGGTVTIPIRYELGAPEASPARP